MGQKVHPYGFRLGYNKDWHSHWYAKQQFGEYLLEDLKLKRSLKSKFSGAGVSHVDIERAANRMKIIIYTSRPGIIIGRKGAEIDKLKADISARTGCEVLVSIQEIHKPELNAQLQAEKIAAQLQKRIAFRRAMRKAVEESLRFGAQGIKVKVSGRLNGAEIARSEWHLQGRLPLHTLRADIDYGLAEAHTTFGVIGVKVWIYRGEILDPKAAMARGTGTDPIVEKSDGRPRRSRRGERDTSLARETDKSITSSSKKPSDRTRPGAEAARGVFTDAIMKLQDAQRGMPGGKRTTAPQESAIQDVLESPADPHLGKSLTASAEQPEVKVEAYGVARIKDLGQPAQMYIRTTYILEAGLLWKMPEGFVGEATLLSFPADTSEINLDLTVHAEGMIIEPGWHQTLVLRKGQDAKLLEFRVTPQSKGPSTIRVDFYHQGHWLSRIKFEVEVLKAQEPVEIMKQEAVERLDLRLDDYAPG